MQIYICIKKSDISSDIRTLECCTNAVYTWLSNNGLALNPSKSEAIKFNCRQQATGQITAINVAEASIQLSMANKSQDMILDSQLTMGNHIVTVNKACYFHIRALCHIRKVSARWRSKDSHKQHHPFSSWLLQLAICRDVWDTNFDKLQQVQNTLACIVMTTREVITSLQFRLLFTGCLLSPEWRLRLCHWHTASANQETWHIFVMLIPE